MCARVANLHPEIGNLALCNLDASALAPIPRPRVRRVLKTSNQSRALGASWHPDSRRAVSVYQSGAVVVWDVVDSQAMQYMPRSFVTSVAVSPNLAKTIVALGGLDNVVSICDMSNDVEQCEVGKTLPAPDGVGHEGMITALAFLDDQALLTASGDGDLRTWDVESGVSVHTFRGHGRHVTSLALGPLSQSPLAASGSLDATVRLWDVRSGERTHTLPATSEVSGVGFFPGGMLVAAACVDGAVRIFDVRHAAAVGELTTPDAQCCTGLAWSLSGRALYTTHTTGQVRVWDPLGHNAGCIHKIPVVQAIGSTKPELATIEIAPDGSALLIACHDGSVRAVAMAAAK